MAGKTVGLIGGAGVKASIELLRRVEELVVEKGGFRDHHHPDILMWQATNSPSRSMYLEGRGDSFIPSYIKIIDTMSKADCTKVYMCCNTAHYALEELQSKSNIEIFNLLKSAVQSVADKYGKGKVGVLCSDGAVKYKLYDKYFDEYSDLSPIYPDTEFQALVTEGICTVKDRADMSHPENCLKKAIQHLQNKGADIILLGCTDLGLSIGKDNLGNIQFIDTIDVIVDDILKDWQLT